MKKFLTAILCMACVLFSVAGCMVNANEYESKSCGASINLFTNSSLKSKLGNVTGFAVTRCYESGNKADAEGTVTYRRELGTNNYADLVKEIETQVRAIQIKTDTTNGLTEKEYDKGFRLLILDGTRQVTADGKEWVESTLRFLSVSNVNSSYYKVTQLKEFNESAVMNNFTDVRSGKTVSLASIEDKSGKYVVSLAYTRADNIPVEFRTGLTAYHLTNAKVNSIEGNTLIGEGYETGSTDKIYALVGGDALPNLTWVIVVAAVLLVAFVTLLILKLTVFRKKA